MEESNFKTYITVKDHSVSKKTFELHYDPTFDMLVTTPKPSENELPKYYESEDYISHTDGKRTFIESLYQFVKQFALKNKLNIINKLQPNKGSLLDIGAGTGDFLCTINKNGWSTIGIEPSEKAKKIAVNKGVTFSESLANLEKEQFDVITMWHVLEHVYDVDAQIAELYRLLKPNGVILIAVPNFKSFDAKHYGAFWAAYDVPRHLTHFSKTAIKLLFEKHDLFLHKILPMKFDAFYVAMLSEKYKSGIVNYLKAFLIGLQSNWKASQNLEYSSHIYVIKKTKN
jgi:2-polyprenyl-3-methyl-5-hydroxy-6-metoxy-1,4-benzoquinol methylase